MNAASLDNNWQGQYSAAKGVVRATPHQGERLRNQLTGWRGDPDSHHEVATLSLFSLRLPFVDQSHIGEARRAALSTARDLGFSEIQQGRAGIVASELATNLAKHTPGGEFILQ
jgi:hypothetical protein